MKIKKTFLVKGKTVSVEYKWGLRDEEGTMVDGLYCPLTRTIKIRNEISKEEKPLVFIHELVHCILDLSHITSVDGGLELFPEEVICDAVADVVTELFDIKFKRVK